MVTRVCEKILAEERIFLDGLAVSKNGGENMLKKIFATSRPPDELPTKEKMPCHVAIIMDGNGRWAKGQGFVRTVGHTAGVKTLKKIVRTANDMGIEALTVYAFSTENWKRPPKEVAFLMDLFSEYLAKEIQEMHEENVRLDFLGRLEELGEGLQRQIAAARELTRNNTGLKFNIAANYGGKDEIVRAAQKLAEATHRGEITVAAITEKSMEAALDTGDLPPVDLVIRTGGDLRLSNFLLWQTAYAELWFTETQWPDFSPEIFRQAIADFAARRRRFGGLDKL